MEEAQRICVPISRRGMRLSSSSYRADDRDHRSRGLTRWHHALTAFQLAFTQPGDTAQAYRSVLAAQCDSQRQDGKKHREDTDG